jgi:hypothetical protein
MGLFSGAIGAGVAEKVIEAARKPQDQRKIESLVSGLTGRRNGGTPGGRGTGRV